MGATLSGQGESSYAPMAPAATSPRASSPRADASARGFLAFCPEERPDERVEVTGLATEVTNPDLHEHSRELHEHPREHWHGFMESDELRRARADSNPWNAGSLEAATPDDHVLELEIAHEEGCCACCSREDGVPVIEYLGFARSYSMECRNDPRFFTSNILVTRLLAFSGLATLSSIFLGFTMTEAFNANKRMPMLTRLGAPDEDGVSDMTATVINMLIFYANIVTTYVAVAQPYHVYRLMTAGPNGADMAIAYYLNPNITTWRHFACKGMMLTMPIYIFARGISLMEEFDRANYNAPNPAADKEPNDANMEGYVFAAEGICSCLTMVYIHCIHNNIFREHYENKITLTEDFLTTMHVLSHSRRGSTFIDV